MGPRWIPRLADQPSYVLHGSQRLHDACVWEVSPPRTCPLEPPCSRDVCKFRAFLNPLSLMSKALTRNSIGSKSTGGSTRDFRLARHAKKSRRKFSRPQLTTACWSLVAAGSRLKARARRSCSSVLHLLPLAPMLLLKQFPVSVQLWDKSLVWTELAI